MRVLLAADVFARASYGGAARYVERIARGLARGRVATDLLIPCPKKAGGWNPLEGKHLRAISTISHDASYDVFHASYQSWPQVRTKARVVTVHDLIDELLPAHLVGDASSPGEVGLKKRAISAADHVIAVSQTTRDDLVRQYRVLPAKVSVVYHGVSRVFRQADRIRPELRQALLNRWGLSDPFLLVVGARAGYKNFLRLLQAFAAGGFHRRFQLVAAGSQSCFLPDELEVISDGAVLDRVVLTGCVSDVELAILYSSAHLVVIPSLYEGFGLPLLEAMAAGTRCASSTAPALKEIGGDVPFYFDPYDVTRISDAIERGVGGHNLGRVAAGRRLAAAFTWQETVQGTQRIYERLSSG